MTVWFTDEAVEAWQAEPRTTRGGQPDYSALAIMTALTLTAVFRLALRQTEGLIGSIIDLLGLDLAVPTTPPYAAGPRRWRCPGHGRADGEPVHLLVDSTGLRLCGPGEWLVEARHPHAPVLEKAHLGMDADTGQIVAVTLTNHAVDDASQVGPLLDQIHDSIASFTGDGAYDQEGVYAGVAERHPEASIVVPPRSTAVPSDTAETAPISATTTSSSSPRTGRMGWQRASGTQTRPDRGDHRQVQRRDRRRAALAHRSASGDRDGRCGPRSGPHAGAGTPDYVRIA